ncbi:tRNA wybutosine-synthesizing protein 4 [Venturia inaequalis]|nr:tRNA wybutosine-synthesizing protein 4 [Venturia inaequalis]
MGRHGDYWSQQRTQEHGETNRLSARQGDSVWQSKAKAVGGGCIDAREAES